MHDDGSGRGPAPPTQADGPNAASLGWPGTNQDSPAAGISVSPFPEADEVAPAEPSVHLEPGAMLGPFQIIDRLGVGGMGEVYRALDTRLGRKVALKVLPKEFLSNQEGLARFALEARSASALNHPNIVTIFEVGRAGSSPYLAMELIDGWTLRQLLDERPASRQEDARARDADRRAGSPRRTTPASCTGT